MKADAKFAFAKSLTCRSERNVTESTVQTAEEWDSMFHDNKRFHEFFFFL